MKILYSNLGPWDLLTSHLLEASDKVEYTYTLFFDSRHGGGREPIIELKKTSLSSVLLSFTEDEFFKDIEISKNILNHFERSPSETEIQNYLIHLIRDNVEHDDLFKLIIIDVGSGICTVEFEIKGETTVEKLRKSRPEHVNLLDIFVTTKVCHIQAIPENLNKESNE